MKRFSGSGLFYLNLPLSLQKTVWLFLLLRLTSLGAIMIIIIAPLLFLLGEELLFRLMYSFHILLFGGLISVSSLPICILQSRPHPEGVLLSFAYFLSFIPLWVLCTLGDEIIFKGSTSGQFVTPLLFVIMSTFISQKVVQAVKV